MTQEPLFVESLEEALRDAINALRGPKEVGVMLWPSMKADLAGRRVNQCLDHDRDEKFTLSELLLIAKRARALNCHTVMAFLAKELSYDLHPIDQEEAINRETHQLTSVLETAIQTANRLLAKQAEFQEFRKLRRVA